MSTQTDRLIKGCAKIATLLVIISAVFSLYIILRSGCIGGLNPYIDERKKEITEIAVRRNTLSGEIFDSSGNQITRADKVGQSATLLFDECYSHLINYNSNGLHKKFYNELRIDKKDHIGAYIYLTTNNKLQEFCYKQLEGKEGSLIVVNSKTGAIMACASRSSASVGYNVNSDEDFENINNFYVNRALMAEDTAGSTIKIVTAAALIENDMEKYTYDDSKGEFVIGDNAIHNYGDKAYGKKISLEKALNSSINTYFSSASIELGAEKLKETADNFLLGQEIELDFTTLKSTYDLGTPGDRWSIAQAAFGQGSVAISPLQITFLMSSVLNEGKIMKPFLIQTISQNGKTIYESTEEILSRATSKSTAKTLKKMLHSTAVGYGFDEKTYGENIYAKTGTSQMANSNKNSNYYLVGLETDSGEYVILVNERNSLKTSSSLKGIAKNVVDFVRAM